MNIPVQILWGFDPRASSNAALQTSSGRLIWGLLKMGHVVDQYFDDSVAALASSIAAEPLVDVQDLRRRAKACNLLWHPADLEWWEQLFQALSGRLKIAQFIEMGQYVPLN